MACSVASASVVGRRIGVRLAVAVDEGVGNGVCVEINAGVTPALTDADGDKAGFAAFSLQPMRKGIARSASKILAFIFFLLSADHFLERFHQ